jgi:hypothetical protein
MQHSFSTLEVGIMYSLPFEITGLSPLPATQENFISTKDYSAPTSVKHNDIGVEVGKESTVSPQAVEQGRISLFVVNVARCKGLRIEGIIPTLFR